MEYVWVVVNFGYNKFLDQLLGADDLEFIFMQQFLVFKLIVQLSIAHYTKVLYQKLSDKNYCCCCTIFGDSTMSMYRCCSK